MRNIPFELALNNIYLKARLNDSPPLWFIFDSGAGASIVNASVAERLGIKSQDRISLTGGGGSIESTVIKGARISLPGATAFEQMLVIAPLDFFPSLVGRRVDGIIGHDFFQSFTVEIDYAAKTLSLYEPSSYRYAGSGDIIPIEIRDRHALVRARLIRAGRQPVEGEFVVDTGSTSTLWVSTSFVAAHKLLETLPGKSMTRFGAGLGGESMTIHLRAGGVQFGRFNINEPVVRLSQEKKGFYAETSTAGTLGGDILRRFKVILDYSRRRMILEPSSNFSEPYETDMSGLDLVAEGADFDGFKIIQVTPDTPGAEAGLRKEDVITAVNGRPAKRLTLDRITRMFMREGQEYVLSLRRGQSRLRTRLKLRRLV